MQCNVPQMLNLSKERIRKTDTDRMSADSGKGTGEPNIENMKLGEARKFELAMLHIDINDFKNKTRALKNEQYLRLVSMGLSRIWKTIIPYYKTICGRFIPL
jgi:hypothetical protein